MMDIVDRLRETAEEFESVGHDAEELNEAADAIVGLRAELLRHALKWSELADKYDRLEKDAEKWKADYESVSKLMNMWGKIFDRDQVERYAAKIGVDPDELIARTNAAIDAAREE